jgi:DNA repair protein RecO (recombination protein O)
MYTINDAHLVEMFRDLRKDIVKLSLGTYFAQVAEVLCQEDMPNPELLSLVLNSLYAIAELDLDPTFVKAVFEMRCACIAGYTPDVFMCHRCGSEYPDRLDVSSGYLECSACRDYNSDGIRAPLSAGSLDAIRYIVSCDSKELFKFQIGQESLENLANVCELYLSTQLERGFSTLDFYKTLFILS